MTLPSSSDQNANRNDGTGNAPNAQDISAQNIGVAPTGAEHYQISTPIDLETEGLQQALAVANQLLGIAQPTSPQHQRTRATSCPTARERTSSRSPKKVQFRAPMVSPPARPPLLPMHDTPVYNADGTIQTMAQDNAIVPAQLQFGNGDATNQPDNTTNLQVWRSRAMELEQRQAGPSDQTTASLLTRFQQCLQEEGVNGWRFRQATTEVDLSLIHI